MSEIEVDAAASAWASAVSSVARTRPGGFARRGPHGTWELITSASTPLLNGVVSTAPAADAEEVAQYAGSSRLDAVAWSIQVRDELPNPAIARIARETGRSVRSSRAFLMRALDPEELVPPSAVRLRSFTVEDRRAAPNGAAVGPRATLGVLSPPRAMPAVSQVRGDFVEVDGHPAGVLSVRVRDMIGILDVAVADRASPAGPDRAAVAAALADAAEDGVRIAFVQCSSARLLAYLALGFRHVETWTLFGPPR